MNYPIIGLIVGFAVDLLLMAGLFIYEKWEDEY